MSHSREARPTRFAKSRRVSVPPRVKGVCPVCYGEVNISGTGAWDHMTQVHGASTVNTRTRKEDVLGNKAA